EGSVTQVSISPDEKFFAFATFKGVVCILERNQILKIRRMQMSIEHQGSEVTALQWNSLSNELFVGDGSGKISVVNISPFTAKNMFQNPTFTLMQLDSRIVQLDWCSELLLISTLSRCYICDTFKEQYRQIGQKLRDGEFGACFFTAGDHNDVPTRSELKESTLSGAFSSLKEGEKLAGYESVQNLKMFCARPGSRLWQVHIDGTVLSTHQFKHAFAIPPTGVIKPYDIDTADKYIGTSNESNQSIESWSQQSFNFTKLHIIAKKFLFTYKRDGIYVLDPVKGDVVLWSNHFSDIIETKTLNDIMYIWTASGQFHAVVLLPLDKFLVRLYLRKQYALCAQLCIFHNNYLLEIAPTSSKLQLLADLGTKLGDNEIAKNVSPLLQEITKFAQEKQNAQRLKSGIFLVGNTQFFWNEEEEEGVKKGSLHASPHLQSLKVDGHKEKSRSLNASPENVRRMRGGASQQQRRFGSTASLPEFEHESKTNDGLTHNDIPVAECHSEAQAAQSESELRGATPHDAFHSPDSAFPLETFQSLKDIKYFSWKIMNTKSLKEKWQVLEGKMGLLSQETNLQPLDVRPNDYQETIEPERCPVEDLELVHSSREKLKHKSSQFPVLDISKNVEICKNFSSHESNTRNACEELFEFLDIFNSTYEMFVSALMRDNCDTAVNNVTVQNSTYSTSVKYEMHTVGPFPFYHYFSDDTVRVIYISFNKAVKSGHLFSWLQSKTQELQHIPYDEFPDNFEAYYTENMLKVDFLLSRLLIIFSDVLDPKIVLQGIKSSAISCYYLSLNMILDRCQEGNLYYVAEESSGTDCYEELPLPLLLSTIFYMFSMERIETCCKLGKQVYVKDAWYLILRLQQHVEATGKDRETSRLHCYSLFLSYLEKLSSSKDSLSDLLTDDQLRAFVSSAFVELNFVENGSCECGFPLLNPPMLTYPELAELIVVYYWENSQEHLLEMCKSVPSLWHLILPRKRSGDFTSILPLIIHLGNPLELTNWVPSMDYADWEKTLELLALFRSGTCLNCGSAFIPPKQQTKGLLWSSLSHLLVKSIGPQKAVQLLTKFSSHIEPGELDQRFFQACIFSAIVDSHSVGLRNEVVDLLSEFTQEKSDTALFSPTVGSSLEEALKEDLGKPVERWRCDHVPLWSLISCCLSKEVLSVLFLSSLY
ncbi:hypothetical protein C0J52_13679, partial [Blattella germanica]